VVSKPCTIGLPLAMNLINGKREEIISSFADSFLSCYYEMKIVGHNVHLIILGVAGGFVFVAAYFA